MADSPNVIDAVARFREENAAPDGYCEYHGGNDGCDCADKTWFPPTSQVAKRGDETALIVITGESGVGKSHLARQLLLDEEYGVERVGIIMSEKSLTTYDTDGLHFNRITDLSSADEVIDSYKRAFTLGRRLPAVLFFDSLTASCDAQMLRYGRDFATGHSVFKSDRTGNRDKLAEYGNIAEEAMEKLSNLRNELPCDIIVIVRTLEPRGGSKRVMTELALPGKVIPDNITGWSDVTLYLKPEFKQFSDDEKAAILPTFDKFQVPHRTFGMTEGGTWDGSLVQRYFYTQNTGEVLAKGHHNLLLKERAILPDVLRKIHGRMK